jgi:hypothetical protein
MVRPVRSGCEGALCGSKLEDSTVLQLYVLYCEKKEMGSSIAEVVGAIWGNPNND